MSAEILSRAATHARRAGVQVCWSQWAALGAYALQVDERSARSIVDIEPLILLTLAMRHEERRLTDFVVWWADTASRFVSVQRLTSMADRYADQRGRKLLGEFAALAAAGGDRRWKRYAGALPRPMGRRGKGPSELDLADPATLQVRLRAGLGVGARADLLAMLIGLRGRSASVRGIADGIGYTGTAVRSAAGDMVLGRFIRQGGGHPMEFFAPVARWAELLDLTVQEGTGEAATLELPEWRFWGHLFPFLDEAVTWSEGLEEGPKAGGRVIASRCRDLVERHRRAFELNGIPVPHPSDFAGTQFLIAFRDTTRIVKEWIEDNI